MDKELRFIKLIFENCDYIKIPYTAVQRLKLNNITYSYDFYKNKTSIYAKANSILLILNINLIKDIKSYYNINGISRILKYADITYLQLYYIDDIVEDVYVNYQGIEYNKLQITDITNDKLIIRIE